MSLTRNEWIEIWNRLKVIEREAHKVWRKKYYRPANNINWEVQRIKDKIQQVIGQME